MTTQEINYIEQITLIQISENEIARLGLQDKITISYQAYNCVMVNCDGNRGYFHSNKLRYHLRKMIPGITPNDLWSDITNPFRGCMADENGNLINHK